MFSRFSLLPAGFVPPCLPSGSKAYWQGMAVEIKHDGFRVIARKDGKRVRLYSRPGNDLTPRFRPHALAWLPRPSASAVPLAES
jgi:ATP-dependent DNA ligase